MKVDITLVGYKEIDEVLKGLPLQVNHKVMQAAHTEAARPLVDKEHLLAPVGKTGKLADSIGVIKPPFAKAGVIGEVHVGPRRGRFGGAHAHFLEFGTRQRVNKSGAKRGSVARKPFAEPAFQQTNAEVLSKINNAVGKKLYQYMKRVIRNG